MVAERVEQKEAELKEVLDEKIRTYKETYSKFFLICLQWRFNLHHHRL